jgi:transcriptional regulator with GAF, ATPase, and Fis domain
MDRDAPADLAEMFGEVARALLAESDTEHTLQRIVDLAVQTVEGCDHAGVTLVRSNKVDTPAASDEVGPRVAAIQYEASEGPCLDAIREHEVFQVDRLSEEQRWPRFSARTARETGVQSILAFRLFVEKDTLGALNLYSKRADAFDRQSRAVGAVFATHAAVALATAQHDAHMDTALASRDLIGQAKGVLMNREGVTADQAFEMLREASQHLNMKLRDVAERVTYTGELPPSTPPRRQRPSTEE